MKQRHDLRNRPRGRVGMSDREDARLDARKLLPRAGRPERRHQPEPVPVRNPVEKRPAVRHRGALVVLARREGAVAAQVLGRLGVDPRDCAPDAVSFFVFILFFSQGALTPGKGRLVKRRGRAYSRAVPACRPRGRCPYQDRRCGGRGSRRCERRGWGSRGGLL